MRRQVVIYYETVVYSETAIRWYFNNKFHRDGDLPAAYYFSDRKLIEIIYFQHGKCHCTTGPAYVNYERKFKDYYYENKRYDSLEKVQMLEACR